MVGVHALPALRSSKSFFMDQGKKKLKKSVFSSVPGMWGLFRYQAIGKEKGRATKNHHFSSMEVEL